MKARGSSQSSREIRLPLQIGTSGLFALQRAALYLVPSFAFAVIAAVPLVWVFWNLGDFMGETIGKYVFFVLFIPVVPFWYATKRGLARLRAGLAERASDLVIADGELRVAGGPHHGLVVQTASAGSKLSREKASTDDDDDDDEVDATQDRSELWLGSTIVAVATRPAECRSLAALHQTIEALGRKPEPPSPSRQIELVTCPSCDAPVVPADAATVPCGHCGAQVKVPDEVRQRCRALTTLADTRPRNQRRLRSLLRQPSARTSNWLLLAIGLPMMLVWPAIGGAGWCLFEIDALHWSGVLALVFAALTIVVALYFLTRVWLVDRQGLALVTLHFGADPPRAPGEPPTCRVCNGPLPAAGKTLFVRCAYCGSDNVLGIDVRGDASREAAQGQGLAEALSRRSRDRLVFSVAALLAIASLAGDARLLRPVVHPIHTWLRCRHQGPECGTPVEALDYLCALGDTSGCASAVASAPDLVPQNDHLPRATVAAVEQGCACGAGAACTAAGRELWNFPPIHDAVLARGFYRRGCDLGRGDSCSELGEILEGRRDLDADGHVPDPPPVPVRSAAARALFVRACEAGYAPGCLDEATYYRTGDAGTARDPAKAAALAVKACQLAGGALDAPGCMQVACDGGKAPRCSDVAIAYAHGDGMQGDITLQLALYARACTLEYWPGCTSVGAEHELGHGGPVDLDTASAMYQRACDHGDGMGCHDLAVLYHQGKGRDADDGAAARLFARACDLKYPNGCDASAELADKRGDAPRTYGFYQRACQLGDKEGCMNVAIQLRAGLGVTADPEEAKRRFAELCEGGYRPACDY